MYVAADTQQLLKYLLQTGPIRLVELMFRSEDLPEMIGTLNELNSRGEIEIQGTQGRQSQVLKDIKERISTVAAEPGVEPEAIRQKYYDLLSEMPDASSTIVQLSEKAFRKLAVM